MVVIMEESTAVHFAIPVVSILHETEAFFCHRKAYCPAFFYVGKSLLYRIHKRTYFAVRIDFHAIQWNNIFRKLDSRLHNNLLAAVFMI